jgi:hypothetical protein
MTKEIPDTETVKAFEEIPDTETVKAFNAEVVDDFRANAGKVGGQFEGAPLLLLTTTGAKPAGARRGRRRVVRRHRPRVIGRRARADPAQGQRRGAGVRRVSSQDQARDPAFRAAAGLVSQRSGLRVSSQ